jgi:hypothetical protein
MMARVALRARRRTISRALLRVAAIPAAVTGCEGTTSPNLPDPGVPVAAQPAAIIKVSGDRQEGRPGDQLQPLMVVIRDPSGRPVPGVRVSFSVTAGQGFAALILEWPPGNFFLARHDGPAPQITNASGEAVVLWFLGRHGENTLVATVEREGKPPLETIFRATSVSSGFAGGTFALTSNGTSVTLYDGMGGRHDCIAKAGSLILSPDGSFAAPGDFDCSGFSFSGTETGLYAVSGSKIELHYLDADEPSGLLDGVRDAPGVISDGKITFTSRGVEWRYAKTGGVAPP